MEEANVRREERRKSKNKKTQLALAGLLEGGGETQAKE